MTDIKINKIKSSDSEKTTIEIVGVDLKACGVRDFINDLLDKSKECVSSDGEEVVEFPESDVNGYMMRTRIKRRISISDIKKAISGDYLDELIKPYDEIDIECLDGRTITVVCAYSASDWARFIFKGCWDKGAMNDRAINEGRYYKSKGRKHVLDDIYPNLAKEWRELMKPRKMIEEINGKRVEYADLMWLPSTTDMFGKPGNCWWNDLDDSFQLPIFQKECERVKDRWDERTYPYWLRSVYVVNSYRFCYVGATGSANHFGAHLSFGFAPGFDIGK